MELVIGIVIFLLAAATVAMAAGPGLRLFLSRFIPGLDPRCFRCRIEEVEEPQLTLQFQICGRIYAPQAGVETVIRIHLEDLTDPAAPKPILTRNPDYQQDGSLEFAYAVDNGPLPSKVSILKDWVTLLELACQELVFPRQGYRTLEATISVVSKTDQKVLAEARGQVLTLSDQNGYESIQQNRSTRRKGTVQLAAAVWNLSGRLDGGRALLEERLGPKYGGPSADGSESLAEILELSAERSWHFMILEACENICDTAQQAERIEILTLCLEIAATAEVISDEVANTLAMVAERIGISHERFHQLRQKILSGHTDRMSDPKHLLGISDSMSEEEVLRQLTREYRKWNARVTHADERVRRQADQMLNLIMELRHQYQHCG